MSPPFAASSFCEVYCIFAPHCLITLLLAILLVQPLSGVDCTTAHLPPWALPKALHCRNGVSSVEDLNCAGLLCPVLPLLWDDRMLHLCLTILAFAGVGLGDLEDSREDAGVVVGEGAGVLPGFPPLLLLLAPVAGLPLCLSRLPSRLPLPPRRLSRTFVCLAFSLSFGCVLSQ